MRRWGAGTVLFVCLLGPVSLLADEPLVLDREECTEPYSDSSKPCGYYMKCDGEKQKDAESRECTERTYSRLCCRHWSNGAVECDPSVVLRVEFIAPPPLVAGCVTEVDGTSGPFPTPE
jgi:hypothetical protein